MNRIPPARLKIRRKMAYISFYRKWRPQDFDEIIGQDFTVRTLKNAVSSERLAHSYMFCGPRGTGKTSTARILAKAINCKKGPACKPCNKCENCTSITEGTNVDIIEIDAASNNGVEHIRELREKVKYIPSRLNKKMYIIDEVHMLSTSAFNALLKVLEEPPDHVMFVMATTEPHKVLPTIMSRCQRFDFFPISSADVTKKLKKVAKTEAIKIDDAALGLIAKYADGSLRDADGILEQLASFGQDRITLDDVSSLLGLVDIELLFEFTDILAEGDIDGGLLFVHRIFSSNQDLDVFLKEFLDHLYNLYVYKNYENPQEIIDLSEEIKNRYRKQAQEVDRGDLCFYIDLYSDLYKQAKRGGTKTLFKTTLIKALNHKKGTSRPDNKAKKAPDKKKDKQEAVKEAGSAIDKEWTKICNLVKRAKISVHAMFVEISSYRADGNNLYFYLDENKGWHRDQLAKKASRDIVAQAVKKATGKEYRIDFLTGQKEVKGLIRLEGQPNRDPEVKEAGTGDEMYAYLIEKFEIKE